MLQISSPFFFLLLGFIPILFLINCYTRIETAYWRKVGTLVLRLTAMICLILALVGLQQKVREDILSVVFLLDISDSVPLSQQAGGIDQINASIDTLKSTDEFSVILFGAQASVRVPMQSKAEQPHLTPDILSGTAIDWEGTNLVGAIQLAISLPTRGPRQQKRLVLLSDGVQNIGDVIKLLDLVRASEIEIFTSALSSEREYEIWVRDLQLPSRVRSSSTFDVRAIVETTVETQVKAMLYRNNIPVADAQWIALKQGKTPIDFQQQIFEEGSYQYRLEIAVDDPTTDNPENNTGYGFTRVYERSRVLYVEEETGHNPLKTILEANHLAVKVISPIDFPTSLVALQDSDVVILSNVSADDLSLLQMKLIESYVRDLGKGLVVIGGDRAFGRGSYQDTPLEQVLPLNMTPRQQKESLALMLVIDASGSMANYVGADQKIQLAIEGIRSSIRAVDDKDLVGVIGFAAKIGLDLQPTTDHTSLIHEVGQKLRPGSGTKMYPALKQAYERLKTIDAKQKHILLLSDGKSKGDFIPLAEQIAADQMTITTIAIGDAEQELMEEIARAGGGQFRGVRNMRQLPKVLADEVQQTQKYTIQEEFQPIISEGEHPILAGLEQVPKLYGYVATSEKDLAQVYLRSHKEHPILAAWNYGLGKSVAFPSDVKPGWGKDWIAWDNFGKFWGQVVNWVLPLADENADFDLNVSHRDGRGQVVIQTTSISAPHTFDVRVARPNTEGEAVELHRITPTQYSGEFPVRERGIYHVTTQKKRDGEVESSMSDSLVLSYPAEFAEFETDYPLLKGVANRTNGIFDPLPEQISHHSGKGLEHLKPLSFVLLVVSVLLFVLEMILRRFSIASGYFADLKIQLRTLLHREKGTSPSTLARLSQKKMVITQRPTMKFTYQPEAQIGAAPVGGPPSEEVQLSTGGSTGRLLHAKRRAGESRK